MTNTKRSVLNLYYAAAEGHEPSSADMAEAGIPVRLHDQVRREARALLVDYYSSHDKTSVRQEAQRLGTRLADELRDRRTAAGMVSKDELVPMPMLDGRQHPIASMYLQLAESGRGEASRGLLRDAGVPEEYAKTVRGHAKELDRIWRSGAQDDARHRSVRFARELVDRIGSEYEPKAKSELPDDPRALAALVHRNL